MNIITKNLEEKAPLYYKYQNEFNPQPAYIELDCRGEGELLADYSGEIGNSVPIYYWNELAVRWGVSAETTGTSLQALFTDQKFLSCCKRIIEAFDEVWDGNNFVGKYTGDASDAIEEAEGIINQTLECCEVWSVEDYLFSNCSLREHWDEQPVEQAVAELESSVENNCEVDGDFEDALL